MKGVEQIVKRDSGYIEGTAKTAEVCAIMEGLRWRMKNTITMRNIVASSD